MLSSSKYAYYPQDYQSNQKTYTYNDFGQLTGYSDSIGDSATYTYYADGLRASKTVNGVTTKYYYDGGNVINESRNGSLYAVNVMGPDGYISRTQGGTTSYYMKNAHGDIVRAVTESAAKTFSATYNAWGEVMDSDNGSGNPIGYAGEFHDEESGMIYLRGRYYDPEIRRFITEDPAKDGWNWYAYCGNNPVMFVDSWGFSYDEVINALDSIYNAKNIMNHTTPGSTRYDNALETARANKDIIRNSDVYIENWGELTAVLSPLINGNNNSLESISEMKNLTIAARDISNNQNFWDDVLFTGAIATTITPLVKVAGGIISGMAFPGKAVIGTNFGKLGTLISNPGISINWASTTMHAANKMAERGVTRQMVESWVANGKVLQQSADKFVYICQEGVAVITSAGKLITAYGANYFDGAMMKIIDKLF